MRGGRSRARSRAGGRVRSSTRGRVRLPGAGARFARSGGSACGRTGRARERRSHHPSSGISSPKPSDTCHDEKGNGERRAGTSTFAHDRAPRHRRGDRIDTDCDAGLQPRRWERHPPLGPPEGEDGRALLHEGGRQRPVLHEECCRFALHGPKRHHIVARRAFVVRNDQRVRQSCGLDKAEQRSRRLRRRHRRRRREPTDLVCTGCIAATDLADSGITAADLAETRSPAQSSGTS